MRPKTGQQSTPWQAITCYRLVTGCFVVWILVFARASADVVILKDGTVLHGSVRKEQTTIKDEKTDQTFAVASINALSFVDDGARRNVFSSSYKRVGEVQNTYNKFAELVQYRTSPVYGNRRPLPQDVSLTKIGEFAPNWKRTLRFDLNQGKGYHEVVQQILILNPYFVRIDSTTHIWTNCYLTKELGPVNVKALLKTHPDIIEKDGPNLDRRMKIVTFFIQAEWYQEAEDELKELTKLFPDDKDKIEKARTDIEELKADQLITEIERARDTGRHEWARNALKQMEKQNSSKLLVKLSKLQAESDTLFQQFDRSKKYLSDLNKSIENGTLKEATEQILTELHPDTAKRLETFLTLADQAENDRKQGRKETYTNDQIVAAAITSWLLGKNSAETKPESAIRLWQARTVLLTCLKTDLPHQRQKLIKEYLGFSQRSSFDELDRMIGNLPPALAENNFPTKAVERKSDPIVSTNTRIDYTLQLPPEYQHGRSYPMLVALPDGTEQAQDMLKKLGDFPARYGMITLIPEWHNRFRNTYLYTAEEHESVLALIAQIRKRFQVDSDRVFLFGSGQAGTMCLDVGLSHPDYFAGIISMSPTPNWKLFKEYWRNAQNLPVYMVVGELADPSPTYRQLLTEWMPRGYPILTIAYKGRVNEWFGQELPFIFDWITRQKRVFPYPMLGKVGLEFGTSGEQYRTLRTTDNRFYWLGTDKIAQKFLFENRPTVGASISGRVQEGNTVAISCHGIEQVTLWLSKGMFDYEKPLRVRINGSEDVLKRKEPIKPSLSVLLDDLHERGDKQRTFIGRIDFTLGGRVRSEIYE